MKLYKFRSNFEYIKDELKNEYLFFAEASELNDSLEGFINLYWQGDIVLWKNLLKHYLYTLANSVVQILIGDKSEEELPMYFDEGHFPTDQYKSLFEDIRNDLFSNKDIRELLGYLERVNHKILDKELISYLRFIHLNALGIIIKKFNEKYLLNWDFPTDNQYLGIFKQLQALLPELEKSYKDILPIVFQAIQSVTKTVDFQMKQYIKNQEDYTSKVFLLTDFPSIYVDQLKKIVFYTPCITCFMESYESPSSWGYYSDSHKGICLIFDDGKNDTSEINFELSGNKINIHTSTQKVRYKKKFNQVDFFKMIGTISLFGLENYWLSDWEGNHSTTVQIKRNIVTSEWHKKYVESMMKSYTTKLPGWKHELEHRIILEKEFLSISKKNCETQKYTYDFKLLKGIIFGIKTPESQKFEILESMKEKCKTSGRTDFKFYQAEYNDSKGEITISEIKSI